MHSERMAILSLALNKTKKRSCCQNIPRPKKSHSCLEKKCTAYRLACEPSVTSSSKSPCMGKKNHSTSASQPVLRSTGSPTDHFKTTASSPRSRTSAPISSLFSPSTLNGKRSAVFFALPSTNIISLLPINFEQVSFSLSRAD